MVKMKNQLENTFISKFDLLNSQENTEEIIWSSEDSDCGTNPKMENKIVMECRNRKRKRVRCNRYIDKNISYLDITYSGDELDEKYKKPTYKSPKIERLSPVLTSSQRHFVPCQSKSSESPIILTKSKSYNYKENKSNSPILKFKHISPLNSPKVRKKLFSDSSNNITRSIEKEILRSRSPVLRSSQSVTQKLNFKCWNSYDTILLNNIKQNKPNRAIQNLSEHNVNFNILERSNGDILSLKTSLPLIEKVKSYFDSNFSSNTTSQSISISECETERSSSKSNDDIEIINSPPEQVLDDVKLKNKSFSDNWRSLEENEQKTKKVKYKKDGLSYRLNSLVKKQNASTSLWLHERYLAENSSFILPSEDFTVYQIQDVHVKYGCFLLEVLDVSNGKYLIILNNIYVHVSNMEKDGIIKVYKPYKVLDFKDYNLVINVCKYEYKVLKK